MLKLEGRPVVVVGAGPVGLRKAAALAKAGAVVRLVAGENPPADLPANLPANIERLTEDYSPRHLAGATVVFACTNDRAVNSQIADDARRQNIPVNAADQPDDCDFFTPATLSDGDVVIAVGTGGDAPGLARLLKHRILETLPDGVGEFAALLGELRRQAKIDIPDPAERAAVMKSISGEMAMVAFQSKGQAAIRKMFKQRKAGKTQPPPAGEST
ncbi:MAG: bifunctional precorrin-2 dehydrogenase/sirohydrochlorin ferrochelatase [Phycisphaerae bacterium]|nr:bifunctional precorrin-2 dehydrogenase/sirohydrochlorin ferrochelatase [Phycisphaerae bacterium]